MNILDGSMIDGEESDGGSVLRAHVGDGGTIGD